jgi:hypothetical protein
MAFMRTRSWLVAGVVLIATTAFAAEGLYKLNIFKSGTLGKGLWQVQVLSTDDATLSQGAAAVGKVGICMDVAERLAKQGQLDDQGCTPKIIKDTKDAAEVNVSCTDGQHSHVAINRETEQSYLIDSDMTDKDGKSRSLKARYTYQGECKGDAAIQMDKNSTACKMMNQVDMSKMAAMCANAPAEYRAQCETQMKSMAGSCQ